MLLKLLSERSAGLREHIDEVAHLSALIASGARAPELRGQAHELAAELHDVGKAAIPDAILNKPGALDTRSGTSCTATP